MSNNNTRAMSIHGKGRIMPCIPDAKLARLAQADAVNLHDIQTEYARPSPAFRKRRTKRRRKHRTP